jgi:glutathione S-transferase
VGQAIRVWGVGTARTFRVHWMLEELGLAYDVEPVQSRTGETRTEAFLALNPRGKIPVLQHGDLVLAESAAIATYLAERFGAGRGLLPAAGSEARAIHDQWCYFVMTELDATALYVLRRHGDLAAIYGEAPRALDAAREYFRRQACVVEDELADGRPFLLGDTLSVADVLLATTLVWAVFYAETLSEALEAYRVRTTSRESYGAAFRANFPPAVLEQLREQRGA